MRAKVLKYVNAMLCGSAAGRGVGGCSGLASVANASIMSVASRMLHICGRIIAVEQGQSTCARFLDDVVILMRPWIASSHYGEERSSL